MSENKLEYMVDYICKKRSWSRPKVASLPEDVITNEYYKLKKEELIKEALKRKEKEEIKEDNTDFSMYTQEEINMMYPQGDDIPSEVPDGVKLDNLLGPKGPDGGRGR